MHKKPMISTNDFEKNWGKKECFPTVFVLYRDFFSESSQKIGLLWDSYPGSVPKQPYQPEFVILNISRLNSEDFSKFFLCQDILFLTFSYESTHQEVQKNARFFSMILE